VPIRRVGASYDGAILGAAGRTTGRFGAPRNVRRGILGRRASYDGVDWGIARRTTGLKTWGLGAMWVGRFGDRAGGK